MTNPSQNHILTLCLLLSILATPLWASHTPTEKKKQATIKPVPSLSVSVSSQYKRIDDYVYMLDEQEAVDILPVGEDISLVLSGDKLDLFPSSPNYLKAGSGLMAVGNTFSIPALESQIMDAVTTRLASAPPPPEAAFGAMMVKIGQGNYSTQAAKAKKIVDEAIRINNVVDQLTGGNFATMPLLKKQMIGESEVSIVFNSAKIYPTYAEVEVYVKVVMNRKEFAPTGSNNTNAGQVELYFGATELKFSQDKGIISGVVGLLGDYAIKIGDSDEAGLWLKRYDKATKTGTFIDFDCNGFKQMGVGARIMFSRDWIKPVDGSGQLLTGPNGSNVGIPAGANDNSPRVYADVNVIVQDFNDFLFGVDISDPFVVSNWEEIVFELSNAWLDMSSYKSPYVPEDSTAPSSPSMFSDVWEGVYIEKIAVTLPSPFKKNCASFADAQQVPTGGPTGGPESDGAVQNANYAAPETCPITIAAENLIIDDEGVSGNFSVESQVPLIGGAIMDGQWGYSLDKVGIQIVHSKVAGFTFAGELAVPILAKDTPLNYDGDFNFTSGLYSLDIVNAPVEKPKKMPIWNIASVTVNGVGTSFTYSEARKEFEMSVTFDELALNIGNPNDVALNDDGSPAKIPGITVYGLKCSTQSPHLSAVGASVAGGDSKVANFPVQISSIGLVSSVSEPKNVALTFGLNLTLMDESENGVSATGNFSLHGELVRNIDGSTSWKYRNMLFDGAELTVSLPHFYGEGYLKLFRGDETYGDGFSAGLSVGIIGKEMEAPSDGKYNLNMMAMFGNVGGYKYFLVDGYLGGLNVPIFGPIELEGFGGGAFYHMRPVAAADIGNPPDLPTTPGTSLSGLVYEPTRETKFGIKFATGITTTSGLVDGLLTCIVRFDQNMSLQNITFWGSADIALPEGFESAVAGLSEKIDEVATSFQDIQATAASETNNFDPDDPPPSGIKANLGISLDFESGFVFHAFADVKIDVPPNLLKGSGTLDIYLNPSAGDWHFYLGGYNGGITVPDFFDANGTITLSPVTATLDYGSFEIRASMYFLTGNTIPGAPPLDPDVAAFFGVSPVEDNRDLLNCGGASPSMGTGIAFGASAFMDLDVVMKGLFCVPGVKVVASAGIGFDVALLKFSGPSCGEGLNGMRAFGRIFAMVEIQAGQVLCIPFPSAGVGILAALDIPNPSMFDFIAVARVGSKEFRFSLNLGGECDSPCSQDTDF